MINKSTALHVVTGAVLLTLLFYRQPPGLNLWIAGLLFLIFMMLKRQRVPGTGLWYVAVSGAVITLLATVLVHSAFSGWMLAVSLIVVAGILSGPGLRSLASALAAGMVNIVMAPVVFVRGLKYVKLGKMAIGARLWRIRIYLIPLLILLVFLVIYQNASPAFNSVLQNSLGRFGKWIVDVFSNFNFALAGTFLLCLVIAALFIVRNEVSFISDPDRSSGDKLLRKRRKISGKGLSQGLINEYRAAVFLFLLLNIAILVLNITDINWVWFNFEWEGQYLKQFVHEGTWLLILSIWISMFLVLYYFRRNLNFYTRNRTLKILSYIWLMQNVVLTISVAIRNFYYIDYFSLAYKRIGVLIFLILVLCGLITIFVKVSGKRSGFYLFRINALAWFIVLVISSSVPWDVIIARYNFSHADRAFLHLNYLSSLSDKALPYLDVSYEELKRLEVKQQKMFPFYDDNRYMSPEEYHSIIVRRKGEFLRRYKREGLLSWNLPEHLAYKQLIKQKTKP